MKISLAAARVNAGYTQTEAAELIGVSRNTLQNWEAYKTSPDGSQIEIICEIYAIPMDYVIFSRKT